MHENGAESPVKRPERITPAEQASFIERSTWIYAKTMPECPHWYTLRRRAADLRIFEAFVREILIHGEVGEYHDHWRPYLHVGDFKYWVMTTSPRSATLINRARREE